MTDDDGPTEADPADTSANGDADSSGFEELVELELPRVMPIFPLANAIVLPGCVLPLNIFEPRYLAMVRDARASHRMIGMIQPRDGDGLYGIGGGGLINDMEETSDGRLLISLIGVCRFRLIEEMSVATPYRQAQIDWHSFEGDLAERDGARNPPTGVVDRARLFKCLDRYLSERGLGYDDAVIGQAPDDVLVDNLAMMIPLSPAEKQALLEADSLKARAELLIAMLEMAGQSSGPANLN